MSAAASRSKVVARLRERIADARPTRVPGLTFGIDDLDDRLADHGLDGAALHEVAAATESLGDDAAATLFAAGVAASFAGGTGRVLWVVSRFDLYAPGLEQVGLPPGRVIFAVGRDDKEVLALIEDALRHGALAAVIGEVKRADITATRRLQLAAEAGNTPVLLLRRWRRRGVCPLSDLSAATTRWRVACAPSARLPAPGVGRGRWVVDLVRQRNGDPFSLIVEACDDTGRLALPAGSRDRAATAGRAARAA